MSMEKLDLRGLVFIIYFFTKALHLSDGILRSYRSSTGDTGGEFEVCEYTNATFTHAESPTWDPQTGTLYWVDVLNQDIHALEYNTFKHRVKHIEYGEVNIVMPVKDSAHLVIGCGSRVYLMDWNRTGNEAFTHIADLDTTKVNNIVNEGKADAYGRLWAGTKGPQLGDTVERDQAALYSIEWPCFVPKVQLSPVTVSNGLVWSLNNTILYYIDSVTNKIDAFDFDLFAGKLYNRRMLINISNWGFKDFVPDGMTIDRDGFLWIALYLNGSVIRVDPDARRVVQVYQLPVSRTTSMTWAGDTLEDLVVTTSRRNLHKQAVDAAPLSGTIFILRDLGTGGVPDHKFIYRKP